jgi:hypothetical protein
VGEAVHETTSSKSLTPISYTLSPLMADVSKMFIDERMGCMYRLRELSPQHLHGVELLSPRQINRPESQSEWLQTCDYIPWRGGSITR